MHAVERELIKATGYKTQRKFDNRQDYLGSILNAVLKLSDADFDAISDDAAEWANAATMAKNSKAEELPDFNEVNYDGEPEADEEDEPEEETESDPAAASKPDPDDEPLEDPDTETEPEEDEADEEPEPVKAKAKKFKAPPKPKTKAKPDPKNPIYEHDAVLDKWGCIEGSKNHQALSMFEKGATAKEVKDAIGGTYYNILGKCVKNGHKLEREGAVIKLTHSDAIAAKKAAKKK